MPIETAQANDEWMRKKAIKEHALSFENVDDLWVHLHQGHSIDGRGGMQELDRLHIAAHR